MLRLSLPGRPTWVLLAVASTIACIMPLGATPAGAVPPPPAPTVIINYGACTTTSGSVRATLGYLTYEDNRVSPPVRRVIIWWRDARDANGAPVSVTEVVGVPNPRTASDEYPARVIRTGPVSGTNGTVVRVAQAPTETGVSKATAITALTAYTNGTTRGSTCRPTRKELPPGQKR